MSENLVDMKAAMLGMTPEQRLELLQEVSLEEQIKRLQEENARLRARRVGRPQAEKLSREDTRRAKVAVVQAFVRVETAGIDELRPAQVHAVIEQTVPKVTKAQCKAVLDELMESKAIEKNGKRGAGAAFFRNK
jgi:hypothetical protein